MKIKAVALDLDGTLLNSKKEITENNLNILREFYKKGVEILIVTGRMYSAVVPIVKQLNLPITVICYNGGKVVDTKYNKILMENFLCTSTIEKLIKLSRELNIHLNIYQNEDWFVENINRWETKLYEKNISMKPVEINFNHLQLDKIIKTLFIGKDDCLNKLKLQLEKQFDNIHITSSQNNYLEILNKNINKGAILEKILKLKGLNISDCVAFGDADNDIEMLTMAGYGVAMGNANENIKQITDYVTDTNDGDGIYKFLKKIDKII